MSYPGMQQYKKVKRQEQLEYHEGKSPAAWAGSWISLAAFLILTYTTTFGFDRFGWAGVIVPSVIILLAGILTLVMKAQGYGTPARDL
ncbi:HGxxPAAW family protein [Luteococcus sp. H138]|uniref:HGxxPAAW family protein n=1 Tax=unclassified Luteococcus TaxID=2639923 RepID=UPI00313B1C40